MSFSVKLTFLEDFLIYTQPQLSWGELSWSAASNSLLLTSGMGLSL